ncbi:hypothetical protein [Actinocrispum wychmicini]|uniref:Uncharacterized protein n=1 Tax=Actinocrispum wychmicini TaxID=1213861 RepID=A0A4R2IU50_9PSEU|nr:hypothetical protein [Actinocrispum wychmicini]TCO48834.1 hypothetical protein EV192_11555 [Actinocrispum wychmicini]
MEPLADIVARYVDLYSQSSAHPQVRKVLLTERPLDGTDTCPQPVAMETFEPRFDQIRSTVDGRWVRLSGERLSPDGTLVLTVEHVPGRGVRDITDRDIMVNFSFPET